MRVVRASMFTLRYCGRNNVLSDVKEPVSEEFPVGLSTRPRWTQIVERVVLSVERWNWLAVGRHNGFILIALVYSVQRDGRLAVSVFVARGVRPPTRTAMID